MVSEQSRTNVQPMANPNSSTTNTASSSQHNTNPNPNSSVAATNPCTENTSPFLTMPNLSQLFKLEGPNYLAWVSQFQPILRGNELQGLVDGTD
jgi:hypothetical protein